MLNHSVKTVAIQKMISIENTFAIQAFRTDIPVPLYGFCRVTSLEQLSLAEFKTAIKMFRGFGWIETQRSKFWPIFRNKVH